jgi:putative transposase
VPVETIVSGLEGLAASVGSIRDAYDNALAETTIGLFKTEAVGRHSPFLKARSRASTALSTRHGVGRLVQQPPVHSQLNYIPPDQQEAAYYAQVHASQSVTPQP